MIVCVSKPSSKIEIRFYNNGCVVPVLREFLSMNAVYT